MPVSCGRRRTTCPGRRAEAGRETQPYVAFLGHAPFARLGLAYGTPLGSEAAGAGLEVDLLRAGRAIITIVASEYIATASA